MRWKLKNLMARPSGRGSPRRQKSLKRRDESVGSFNMRNMAALRNHDEFRAGDRALIGERMFLRKHAIVIAPDEQGRHINTVQPFGKVRIMAARLPGQLGDRSTVFECGVLIF